MCVYIMQLFLIIFLMFIFEKGTLFWVLENSSNSLIVAFLMSYLINTIFYFYSTIKIVGTVILGGEVNVREAFCAALNILNAIFSANFTM